MVRRLVDAAHAVDGNLFNQGLVLHEFNRVGYWEYALIHSFTLSLASSSSLAMNRSGSRVLVLSPKWKSEFVENF